jgi:hypothetical protein
VINSDANIQVFESIWMLKLPSNNKREERDEAIVRTSEKKDELGLGGW